MRATEYEVRHFASSEDFLKVSLAEADAAGVDIAAAMVSIKEEQAEDVAIKLPEQPIIRAAIVLSGLARAAKKQKTTHN